LLEGSTTPPIPATGELDRGDRLKLDGDAVVAIIHSRACEELELQGGVLVVGPNKVKHSGSKIINRIKGDCPGAVTLVETDAKGAVTLMRGSGEAKSAAATASGPRPRFIVGGNEHFALAIFEEGREVARLGVERGRAAWPDGAAPLRAGGRYAFVLEGAGAAKRGGGLVVSADGPGVIVLRP
ncbi:MAG: hypothetical protein AAGF90_19480, partial [Pseudomonadota bacterium]